MPDPAIATAADYADAMITARRATRSIILLLILLLIAQMTLFFLFRYDVLKLPDAAAAATQPVSYDVGQLLNYATSGCLFLGLTFTIVLSFILLLIVNIMLVGRLIGVGRLTSAYIWCLVLLVLLFPWQAFLNNVGLTADVATWKLPGVLYTWGELSARVHFDNGDFLGWARFVAWPLAAVVILLVITVKSNRGMRQALGEDEASTADDMNV